ncbi:MAG TPA: magnesium-translocating P-type ATPase [Firmicutes bacterium]|nr:magnesium-translocating P-type ATPase [Bacillota bacterium]
MKKTKRESINYNVTDYLYGCSEKKLSDLFSLLDTTAEGISSKEVDTRLEQYGPNDIEYHKPIPWFVDMLRAFANPFNAILFFLGIISYIMDVRIAGPKEASWTTVISIAIMIGISGLLRFFQEYRSNKEADKLKQMIYATTDVLRKDVGVQEINIKDLVPGDIIHLAAGDMIPADIRVISAKDLFVSQSALTGESEPVEKFGKRLRNSREYALFDLENICFMGSIVVSGAATAVVLSTGKQTYFGSMAESLKDKRVETSFEKGVNSVSLLLIRFMLIMVPLVFLINGFTKKDWLDAFLFAISVAVGLTPQMLPMIVTTNLAKGSVTLAKQKTIVKDLNAIQNFGAMDILCTDKTGTLTIDKIVLEKHLNIHGIEDDRVLRHAYLNSYYQTGLKNLLDVAILEFGAKKGFKDLEKRYTKVDEIPFDFNRRRMSVVLEDKNDKRQLVTKGAVEEMLSICRYAEFDGKVIELDESIEKQVLEMVAKLNNDGMRVIAVAQKNEIPKEGLFSVKDESDMVLMGYIGFLDPLKETAKEAIEALQKHGVAVKVLTGDNENITRKICRDVGLPVDKIILGNELDHLSDEELSRIVEDVYVFAKLTPMQKARVIRLLKDKGHTVGYMGDGINDAPALKEADVGISVDNAVDIAKESADIILLEKSLMVLEKGVIEGRRIFGNIVKYIKMTTSSNFGNVFSVVVASAFLPFLPMLPVQLLVQNLLYDISQISIPWDNMDEEYLREPRKWDADDLGRFMVFVGPISSIFDIATFWVMWHVFGANTVAKQSLFHSGWFVVGLISQTLIVHMIRTEKIPFIQSNAAPPVLLLTSLIIASGVIIPYTTFGASIGLQPLPLAYFPWLIGILLGYCLLMQIVKKIYIKKYGSWL